MEGTWYTSEHAKNVCIRQFESDFFVVTKGTSEHKGERISQFAADTALWGYTHIRQRHYYWVDKKKLVRRIIRSTNIALWQKQRDQEYIGETRVDGSVVILGRKKAWVGTVGLSSIYEKRKNGEWRVMGAINNGANIMSLGSHRYDWRADVAVLPFEQQDTLCVAVGPAAMIPVSEMNTMVTLIALHPADAGKFFQAACGDERAWGVFVIRKE